VTIPLSCQRTNITNPTRKHKKLIQLYRLSIPAIPASSADSTIHCSQPRIPNPGFSLPKLCSFPSKYQHPAQQQSGHWPLPWSYGMGILAPNSPNRHRQPASDRDRPRHSLLTQPMTATADLFDVHIDLWHDGLTVDQSIHTDFRCVS